MAIAQMNWGRMKYPPSDPRLKTFLESLDEIYGLAEQSNGFIWRIAGDTIAAELKILGFDERTSATVSVWSSVEDLYAYTYNSLHGEFFQRRNEWFERVEGPQLVIWNVDRDSQPSFFEAYERLEYLRANDSSDFAYGWKTIA